MTVADPPPYTLTGIPGSVPLVVASPHSGRVYPDHFLAQTRLTMAQLRRAEDAWVDHLLEPIVGTIPFLAARYGRACLDLNRAENELDPAMIADPLPAGATDVTDRVTSGLGIIPRIAAYGLDIYGARLRLSDVAARIESIHRPWHQALGSLVRAARDAHGHAILLDCHSMPTPSPGPGGRAQVVIGDLHGRSASATIVDRIERSLLASGVRVARNTPYAGGYTTAHHADPANGVHVVQIEIDRALYMDCGSLRLHAGAAAVTAMLGKLLTDLCDAAVLPDRPPLAIAAE